MSFIKSLPLHIAGLIPPWFILLCLRLSIFFIFWNSAQARLYEWKFLGYHWKFWEITSRSFYVFDEFAIPLLSSEASTYIATFLEFFLSLFILFGFFTRWSALGLLAIVLVIQLFAMPNAWPSHLVWASVLLYLLKHGAGTLSLDRVTNRS